MGRSLGGVPGWRGAGWDSVTGWLGEPVIARAKKKPLPSVSQGGAETPNAQWAQVRQWFHYKHKSSQKQGPRAK